MPAEPAAPEVLPYISWGRADNVIAVGEATAAKRRVIFPIYLDDGSSLATSGSAATTPPAGTIQVSINGAAFADGLGTFAHLASGIYYYEAAPSEVAAAGFLLIKFVRTGFKTDGAW